MDNGCHMECAHASDISVAISVASSIVDTFVFSLRSITHLTSQQLWPESAGVSISEELQGYSLREGDLYKPVASENR